MKKLVSGKSYGFLVCALGALVLLGACKQIVTETVEKIVTVYPGQITKAGHAAGDILLDDGSWILKANVASLNTAALGGRKAVGVLAFERGGKPYCVGLQIEQSRKWASDSGQGFDKDISALVWKGDAQGGSESLAALKSEVTDYDILCPYHAFQAAEQYGADISYKSSPTAGTWYLPSIWELIQVNGEKAAINDAFAKLNEIDNTSYPDDTVYGNSYWSSSEMPVVAAAWACDLAGDGPIPGLKSQNLDVLVMRSFDY
ncbi:MAG: hypothetical protein IJ191_04190 [Treponema sp.]|nr:hypothetical protein [Treponema sp.]